MSRLMAKIHIAKAQLGMDDDTYRALLARVSGVRSAKDLGPRQIAEVLREFERLGFQAKPATKAKGRAKPNPSEGRQALIDKIGAQLTEAGRPWSYADAMAFRMFKVARVEWCDPDQLRRIVAALAYDAKRNGRRQ